MPFKIGDAVQLKGGSPIMTVTHLGKMQDGKQNVTCVWFDKDQNEKTSAYHEDALEAADFGGGSTAGDEDDGDFMTR